MREMTINEALQLTGTKSKAAITIYVKASDDPGQEGWRVRAKLSRLVGVVERALANRYDVRGRERLLKPLRDAIGKLQLIKGKGGAAIYHSEEFTGIVRLPGDVPDLAVAADSFHMKPVLRCLQTHRSFYLLAIRKRVAELLLVEADGVRRIDKIRLNPNPAVDRDGAGADAPRAWFRDGLKLRRKRDLRESMELLGRRLQPHVAKDRLPLVVAGLPQAQEAFRRSCSYYNILERGMVGSLESLDRIALTGLARRFMETHCHELDDKAVGAFQRAKAAGLTSVSLPEIAAAAARGQVQQLFVAEDRHLWGHLDRTTGEVSILARRDDGMGTMSDDLLDDLAELAIQKGAPVTVLPIVRMPGTYPIAAILRRRSTTLEEQQPEVIPANPAKPRRQSQGLRQITAEIAS